MNDLTKRTTGTALTTDLANKLLAGIAQSRSNVAVSGGGGKPFLRMLKSGDWVFGQGNDEIQDGSRWALNIMTMSHGWCCWSDYEGNVKNKLLGEVMASVMESLPAKPTDIEGNEFVQQRGCELKCLDGDDKDVEVSYRVTSVSGMKALDTLLGAIQTQLRTTPAYPCPVIRLEHDHYEHTKYGRIFTPVYSVVDWCDMDGNLASAKAATSGRLPDPEPVETPPVTVTAAPAATAATPKTKKPSLTQVVPPVVPSAAPLATAQLHTGQRRRPAAR